MSLAHIWKGKRRFDQNTPNLAECIFLRSDSISIHIVVGVKKYFGFLNPSDKLLEPGIPVSFELYWNGEHYGTIFCGPQGYSPNDLYHNNIRLGFVRYPHRKIQKTYKNTPGIWKI